MTDAPPPTIETIIVVPCYNEEKRLPWQDFVAYAASHPKVGFLFVDDGSRDRTVELLERLYHENPLQLRFLRRERNGGKAEAVRSGILAAIESGSTRVGFWDADLSTPLDEVDQLTAVLGSGTLLMVIGSRVKLLGKHIRRKMMRHYLGRIFATCASVVLGIPLRHAVRSQALLCLPGTGSGLLAPVREPLGF